MRWIDSHCVHWKLWSYCHCRLKTMQNVNTLMSALWRNVYHRCLPMTYKYNITHTYIHDYLITVTQVYYSGLTTTWSLWHKCITVVSRLPDHCDTSVLQWSHDCLITVTQVYYSGLTTTWSLWHKCITVVSRLPDHCDTSVLQWSHDYLITVTRVYYSGFECVSKQTFLRHWSTVFVEIQPTVWKHWTQVDNCVNNDVMVVAHLLCVVAL